MINTKIKKELPKLQDPIELININFANFLKDNKPILTQFVKEVPRTAHFLLSINQTGKVQIINNDYDSFKDFIKMNETYGMSNTIYIIEKDGVMTIDNQIIKILTAYQSFLQKNVRDEQKMNFLELSTLDSRNALFTEQAYICYAVPRIMTGDINILNTASEVTIINNFDFFAKALLAQRNFATSLKNTELRNYLNVLYILYWQSYNTTTAAITVLKSKIDEH